METCAKRIIREFWWLFSHRTPKNKNNSQENTHNAPACRRIPLILLKGCCDERAFVLVRIAFVITLSRRNITIYKGTNRTDVLDVYVCVVFKLNESSYIGLSDMGHRTRKPIKMGVYNEIEYLNVSNGKKNNIRTWRKYYTRVVSNVFM